MQPNQPQPQRPPQSSEQYSIQPSQPYPEHPPEPQPYPMQPPQWPPNPMQSSPQWPPYPMQPPQQWQPYPMQSSSQWPPPQQQSIPLGPSQYQPYSMQSFQQPQPYPMQPQQQLPYSMQPPVVVQNYYQPGMQPSVTINITHTSSSFLLRVIYFIFIGWWAGFFWLNLGFLLCFTVILLPLGLVMLNRLPGVLTLRPNNQQTTVAVSANSVTVNIGGAQQINFLARAVYFVFVGWWAGYFWAVIGYFLCLTILLMPIGLIMLNRLPVVLTLRKN